MRWHRQVSVHTMAFVLALFSASPSGAETNVPTVSVNGQSLGFDRTPTERSGHVFVPLRGVFEHLGASVAFADGTIRAVSDGQSVTLRIGSTVATINGRRTTMDQAPFAFGSRAFVPLRFLAQALGATVTFDAASQTISINHVAEHIIRRPPVPAPVPTFRPGPTDHT